MKNKHKQSENSCGISCGICCCHGMAFKHCSIGNVFQRLVVYVHCIQVCSRQMWYIFLLAFAQNFAKTLVAESEVSPTCVMLLQQRRHVLFFQAQFLCDIPVFMPPLPCLHVSVLPVCHCFCNATTSKSAAGVDTQVYIAFLKLALSL